MSKQPLVNTSGARQPSQPFGQCLGRTDFRFKIRDNQASTIKASDKNHKDRRSHMIRSICEEPWQRGQYAQTGKTRTEKYRPLSGVADGARTHDNGITIQGSTTELQPPPKTVFNQILGARQESDANPRLKGRCLSRLSYGRSCRFVLIDWSGRVVRTRPSAPKADALTRLRTPDEEADAIAQERCVNIYFQDTRWKYSFWFEKYLIRPNIIIFISQGKFIFMCCKNKRKCDNFQHFLFNKGRDMSAQLINGKEVSQSACRRLPKR